MVIKLGCDGKVQYRTYHEAKKKVRQMKRSPHIDSKHQTLTFYRCDYCHFYHIGNSSGFDKVKRKGYKRGKHDKRIVTPE